ncbi:DJ-1/PfpI family protein [Streptomyces flavofungini]|uniref:DJ-1/PfpI family protein n=1 Tax=Streptomyces flavofungini TaxID=68200 RepID=UPI0019C618AC|nr:DJ-1/PfpI family protein [Streptomyces flavofungini]GHC89643.1 hypothetical protein GCM10010349_77710 [Streptomyces flavofungini]
MGRELLVRRRCCVRSSRQGGRGIRTLRVWAAAEADLLVLPGFEVPPALDVGAALVRLEPAAAVIRARGTAGTAVVAVCVGAFLLAEAGLLRRREETTSWLYADRLARRYPTCASAPSNSSSPTAA